MKTKPFLHSVARKSAFPILVVTATALSIASASADLLRYEPFDYTAGQTVQGLTNPDGETWLRAGNANPPTAITVAMGHLSLPIATGGPIDNSGKISGTGGASGSSIRLPLGQTIADGSVYFSFALRIDELTGANSTVGGFFIGLNNTAVESTSNPTVAGARIQSRIDPNDGTKFNLGIFRNVAATAGAASWSGPLDVGQTLFIVASYDMVTGTQNDVSRLWINPVSTSFGENSLEPGATLIDNTTGTGSDLSGAASLILRQSPAPYLTMDELRIGTTWADVTPVPEPSTIAFLGIGAAGLLAARRLRR